MKTIKYVTFSLLLALIGYFDTSARTYYGTEHTMKQPDGTFITVLLYGTELYIDAESSDHYTLIKDESTGFVCYALLAADGNEYASSGIKYTGGQVPEAVKLLTQPGIRISKESRNSKIKETKAKLNQDKKQETVLRVATVLPDTVYGVCVLIDFTDTKSDISIEDINVFLNSDTETINDNAMSIKQYFSWISGGKLTYINYVPSNFYTAPETKEYYSPSDADDYTIDDFYPVIEAALLSYTKEKDGFDVSDLTSRRGSVCAINVLYAGTCTNEWETGLWPHQGEHNFNLKSFGYSQWTYHTYQISDIGTKLGMGTFVHESGHLVCDWPDFYSYDKHDDNNAGTYNVADAFYIANDNNPDYPNAWAMDQLGWLSHRINISDIDDGRLVDIKQGVGWAAVYEGKGNSSNEKYYLEVRDHHFKDYYIKSNGGIFIWHSNDDGDNCTEGKKELLDCKPATEDNPMWTSTNGAEVFNDSSDPNAVWVSGEKSDIYLWNFSAYDTIMSFRCGKWIETPFFTTETMSDGGLNGAYYDSIATKGGEFPLTFIVESGSLPDGLTLNSNGTVAGIASKIGSFTFSVKVTDLNDKSETKEYTINISDSSPYATTYNIPGSFNMEYFDLGGANVAYYDADKSNSGSILRKDNADVYIQSISNGYSIMQTTAGEWTQYSVNVKTSGLYTATFRHSTTSDATIGLYIDGISAGKMTLTGVANASGTSNRRGYTTSEGSFNLTAGEHKLRFKLEDVSSNVYTDSVSFELNPSSLINTIASEGIAISPNPTKEGFYYRHTNLQRKS
ncbi:MAG: carbohydrate-binding protein [Paludibacteraceae bacterium]